MFIYVCVSKISNLRIKISGPLMPRLGLLGWRPVYHELGNKHGAMPESIALSAKVVAVLRFEIKGWKPKTGKAGCPLTATWPRRRLWSCCQVWERIITSREKGYAQRQEICRAGLAPAEPISIRPVFLKQTMDACRVVVLAS
jgi:hypothetical protein